MQKGNVLIFLLVGIFTVAAIAGAFYLGRQTTPKLSPNPVAVSPIPQPVKTSVPVTSTSSAPTQATDTANWKIYASKDYRFKYPSNGDVVTDQPAAVYISANTQPYFTFKVITEDNSNHLTTKQVIDKLVTDLKSNQNAPWAKSQADQTLQTMQEYTNGQIIGIKLQSFDEGYPQKFGEVVEAVENKIYRFSVGNGSGGGVSDEEEKLLDQILSTFKFLDQN